MHEPLKPQEEVEIVDNDAEDFDPFAGGELDLTAPVTPEQEELWISVQLGGTPANLAYNQALALRLRGVLDTHLLRECLDALVARHEALRATLSGDGASLCIARSAGMTLRTVNLTDLPADARTRELAAARRNAVNEEFDLIEGPLVHATLLAVSQREHLLILVAHHLICDGTSWGVLLAELAELYAAHARGSAPNLPDVTPFSEYAAARLSEATSAEAARDLAYWQSQYKNLPPELELPLDRPRPPQRTFAADRVDLPLPPDLLRGLKSAAARQGASLATLLFAAFQAYLQRITGQRSFAVIMPASGQTIAGKKALVGHCVRTLPIRAEVDPSRPFHEHLRAVKASLLDALEHPRITCGGLLKTLPLARDPSRIPLSSVVFNVDSNAGAPPLGEVELSVESLPRAYESFELFVSVGVSGDEALIEACFNRALFDRSSIEQRMQEFVTLLGSVATDTAQRVGELELLGEQQRRRLLVENNRSEALLPTRTLCAQFCEQARLAPERSAVRSRGRRLSYGELERASAALAQELVDAGVGPGERVGVFLSRSVDLPVALLGILRAGAAYVPLDPDYPAERLAFITEDAGLRSIVSERELAARLPQGALALLVDEQRPQGPREIDASRLSAPAYMIYTSGSTGKPKGVVVEHGSAANILASVARRPGLSRDDIVLAVTTPCFDISVVELFLPLTLGAELVIAGPDEILDGVRLGELLERSGATFMQATPSGWRVLLDAGWAGKPTLKLVSAGEALGNDLASALLGKVASVWNGYGPTECSVYSTFDEVTEPPATIGKPVDNARLYVLDQNLRLVPEGVTGELFVGGVGVARGYHERPELDQARFLDDPFAPGDGARMYRTGDQVRWRRDGRLEWLGRNDSQVKVRGHRIELGEIEAALVDCAGVREGVVTVREDQPGDQRIVAYVRLEPAVEIREAFVREALGARLPAYMVPQHVVVLPRFPLTPNGKIDRKALPAPESAGNAGQRPPASAIEQNVAREFRDLVGARAVGLDDDFFALGGHSLLALRLVARLRVISGVDVPVRVVFQNATVKGLSDYVEAALVVQRGSGVRSSPATPEREELLL
jgi:amino acid adenylation domain-containing protein